MLRLTKREGSPHWQITGTLRGGRYRESTGTDSHPHAEAILAKRQSEILDRDVFGEKRTAIFAEAVEIYLQNGGEARFVGPLLERWGTWRIAEISASEVVKAAHELYPDRTAATLDRQLYTPLNSILRNAARAEMCELRLIERPRWRRKPVAYASDQWINDFMPHANARLQACVLFMTLTAARVAEACRLLRRDVDLARGKALLGITKNGKPREVALAPILIEALAPLLEVPPDGRVFGYASRYSVNQAIKRACKRAGIAYLSSHKVGRHAFAARLLKQGASLRLVQVGGGWSNLGIVAEHYGHLEQSDIDRAITSAGTNLTHIARSDVENVLKFKNKA